MKQKKENTMNKQLYGMLLTVVMLDVNASELVYQPVNPNFGGSPLNGSQLLSNANAQNNYKDPDSGRSPYSQLSALDRFTSSLESRLLSQLLSDIDDGNSGSLVTDDFIIDITDDSGTLTVVVTDLATGEVTEIEVNGLDTSDE